MYCTIHATARYVRRRLTSKKRLFIEEFVEMTSMLDEASSRSLCENESMKWTNAIRGSVKTRQQTSRNAKRLTTRMEPLGLRILKLTKRFQHGLVESERSIFFSRQPFRKLQAHVPHVISAIVYCTVAIHSRRAVVTVNPFARWIMFTHKKCGKKWTELIRHIFAIDCSNLEYC